VLATRVACGTATRDQGDARTLDLWYKNAVIYCVDVQTFMDSTGDGIGDVNGLTHRLDHLSSLGISCI
jgi:maltose alpha-D-glucosyltransferase/alpha-amylase